MVGLGGDLLFDTLDKFLLDFGRYLGSHKVLDLEITHIERIAGVLEERFQAWKVEQLAVGVLALYLAQILLQVEIRLARQVLVAATLGLIVLALSKLGELLEQRLQLLLLLAKSCLELFADSGTTGRLLLRLHYLRGLLLLERSLISLGRWRRMLLRRRRIMVKIVQLRKWTRRCDMALGCHLLVVLMEDFVEAVLLLVARRSRGTIAQHVGSEILQLLARVGRLEVGRRARRDERLAHRVGQRCQQHVLRLVLDVGWDDALVDQLLEGLVGVLALPHARNELLQRASRHLAAELLDVLQGGIERLQLGRSARRLVAALGHLAEHLLTDGLGLRTQLLLLLLLVLSVVL